MRFGAHDPAGARLSAASASAPASPPALALACAGSGRAFLHKLRRVIDQKRVKVQAVRQDEVADVAPPNLRMVTRAQGLQRNRQCRLPGGSTVAGTHRHRVEADRVFALERHLDLLQVRVHGDVDTSDSAVADGAVLELDGHRLVGQLHQKPHQLPG